ncbi:hypothetical protein FB45DRAFT_894576 [Roridomyces roridus]|uniref:F-box domain-containing protein n=1 Tax=Roridomyces roridus TaxID=1738132 RepID=A0AAD7CG66_9AGAR|nr:hypothetical protein FB45DRAFT_894576 [Roridomyces roridus]
MKRLANVELLGISRVCPRWHQLIMGTSCLWNCVDLDLRVWDDEFDPQLLTLLRVVLDHGGNFPLDLGVVCGDGEATSRGLNVLATYSCRWRNVSISAYGPQKHLRLPAIEGNLPLLENLAIEVAGLDEAGVIPFFQVAPRLATVRVRALTSNISKLPLEQLKLLVFGDPEGPKELDDVTRIMTRLSGEVGIYLHLVGWEEQITAPRAEASPQVSNAFELFIRGRNASQVSTEAADLAMQDFLARLTLPRLRTLYVDSTGRQLYFPMPWSTDQFLALAHRSSFSTHLRTLILFPVFITEAELLQTLSSLDSLDDLTISDRKMINAEWGDLAVLTDSLLQHLTWTPGLGCVVPALRCFRCHTQLKFDDGLLRDFVLSRVRRELASAFEVELLWDQDHHRELDSGMLAQFEELSSRGELIFSAKPSALFQD